MPFSKKKSPIQLSENEIVDLEKLSNSRTEKHSRVERARILLEYHKGIAISRISKEQQIDRSRIYRCINKALEMGSKAAMDDLPRSGKPPEITSEAIQWVISLACTKPKLLGYASELWTMAQLSKHIQTKCQESGHPSLVKIGKGTVSKILSKQDIKPYKISYYLERRDPDFDQKMNEVLFVYKEVNLLRSNNNIDSSERTVVKISYDEKPGIQAIANIAPDLDPVPKMYSAISRDHEYRRLGTISLLAGIDLVTGKIMAIVRDKHRSQEFIEFLKHFASFYPPTAEITIVMDNHTIHTSKETRAYLATIPNRFKFVFTPKHGSWLNVIEIFFSKMARSFLRGIRVSSKQELVNRILQYLEEVNELPVPIIWSYKM